MTEARATLLSKGLGSVEGLRHGGRAVAGGVLPGDVLPPGRLHRVPRWPGGRPCHGLLVGVGSIMTRSGSGVLPSNCSVAWLPSGNTTVSHANLSAVPAIFFNISATPPTLRPTGLRRLYSLS
ncbi:unnamed protein product [Gadus morhua 'NCC']